MQLTKLLERKRVGGNNLKTQPEISNFLSLIVKSSKYFNIKQMDTNTFFYELTDFIFIQNGPSAYVLFQASYSKAIYKYLSACNSDL